VLNKVICVIPVRMESSRFNGKPLSLYKGKTLIENAILNAKKLDFVDEIIVASGSDDNQIKLICKEQEVELLFQKEMYNSGSERLRGVREHYPDFETFMTIPIDEPSIDPLEVNRVYDEHGPFNGIVTLYSNFYNKGDVVNPNSCKIVMSGDRINYTSRAIIPSSKSGGYYSDLSVYKRHVGVFFFPSFLLFAFGDFLWKEDDNARIESLEQNNFLAQGLYAYKIRHNGFGIDIASDNRKLEERMVETYFKEKI